MEKINVKQTTVSIVQFLDADYISLTDIAKYKSDEPSSVIAHWMRNRNSYSGDMGPLFRSIGYQLQFLHSYGKFA